MGTAAGDIARAASGGWGQMHEAACRWAAACKLRRRAAARQIQVAWRASSQQVVEGRAWQAWAATRLQAVIRARSARGRMRVLQLFAQVAAHWHAAARLQAAVRAWEARKQLQLMRGLRRVVSERIPPVKGGVRPEEGAADEEAIVRRAAMMAKANAQAKVRNALRARGEHKAASPGRGREVQQARWDRQEMEERRRRETAEADRELGRLLCSTDADRIESSLRRLQATASLEVRAEARAWVGTLRGMARAKREECLQGHRHAVALQALLGVQDRMQLELATALISALPLEESRQMVEEMQAAMTRVAHYELTMEQERCRREQERVWRQLSWPPP